MSGHILLALKDQRDLKISYGVVLKPPKLNTASIRQL